jgi:hypothetical protein
MLRPFRWGIFAVLALSATLCAADPTPGKGPSAGAPKLAPAGDAKPEPGPPRERVRRDPTRPGPTLRPLISKQTAAVPAAIPSVELKGRILAGTLPPRVTLAIGTQLHMVPEGSRISLPGAGEIHVSKITAEVVELEILPARYTLTLH